MFNTGTHCHWMYVFRIFVTGMRQGGGVAGSQRTGSSAQHNSLIREGVNFFFFMKVKKFSNPSWSGWWYINYIRKEVVGSWKKFFFGKTQGSITKLICRSSSFSCRINFPNPCYNISIDYTPFWFFNDSIFFTKIIFSPLIQILPCFCPYNSCEQLCCAQK